MPALSESIICNIALSMLGAERITALTDDSNTARLCNALYAYVRNSVLTDYPWSFAQKRVALATVAGTPVFTDDMVTIIYQLPTDFLQLNYVSQMGALVRIESDKLLSDTASLKIKYTYELTDTSKFKAKFVEALAARLAAELAVPITSQRTLAESLFTIYYDKKLPQAISLDSQQETPKDPVQNEWLDARKIGTSEISGPAGWSTWYPPNWW